jgi:hypothetical protein
VQSVKPALAAFVIAVCFWGLAGRAEEGPAGTVRIESQSLALEFEARDNTFSVTAKDPGLTFIERGALQGRAARGRGGSIRHPIWGQGSAVTIEYDSGAGARLMLFPELPFVVFESTLANKGSERATVA